MRKIKNWKLFFESVEDSLEDIKWILVDYDVEDYEYYPNSSNLISFIVNDKQKVHNEISRIKDLASEEGWNVLLGGKLTSPLIFYKGDIEEAVMNWLDENWSDGVEIVKNKQFNELYYMKNDKVLFTHKTNGKIDIEVSDYLYSIPLESITLVNGLGDKFDDVLKKWMKKTFNIDVRNIYYDED